MSVFTLHKPDTRSPLVFDSPHSGRHYPDDFNYICDLETLRAAEDSYVDEIFSFVPSYGAAYLCANIPRSYIDVNRAVDDIDHALLSDTWMYGPTNPTIRSDAGIGLIRRLVKPGVPLYREQLTAAEVMRRIETYYVPYHQALSDLIDDAHYHFGHVYHINCHSMPNHTAYPKHKPTLMGNKPVASDIVLSNQDGHTCSTHFTHAVRDCFESMGYRVSINDPFKGVELISRYSAPTRGRHSLQIEINKSLYVDEKTSVKHGGFEKVRADMEQFVRFVIDYVDAQNISLAAD